MDIQQVIGGLNELFQNRETDKVEDYLSGHLESALKEGDAGAAITIINELIGFYRDTSQYDKAEAYCSRLLPFMEKAGLKDTVHYGTSCINIANVYRASGRLEDSMAHYRKVFEIYDKVLDRNDFLYASLYNNLSLLYQEMGEFEQATEALCKALEIVRLYPEEKVKLAVTCSNLAACYVRTGDLEEAEHASAEAMSIFQNGLTDDFHYSASVSVAADIQYQMGNYEQAAEFYQQAMQAQKRHVGLTHAYFRIVSNLQMTMEKLGKPDALKGLVLSRDYYREFGHIFPQRMADCVKELTFAKVGEGSDCFGWDDILSMDHDFGPGFCVFVSRENYAEWGEELEKVYSLLPQSYRGFDQPPQIKGAPRYGVLVTEEFFSRILELSEDECAYLTAHETLPEETFLRLSDWQLCTVTNGEIFDGENTSFIRIYQTLKKGYPEKVRLRKMAQLLGECCQDGQYNYQRLMRRGDLYGAMLMQQSFAEKVIGFLYLVNRRYAPHRKWLIRGTEQFEKGQTLLKQVKELMEMKPDAASYAQRETVEWIGKTNEDDQVLQTIEEIARGIVELLGSEGITTSKEPYLEKHIPELLAASF